MLFDYVLSGEITEAISIFGSHFINLAQNTYFFLSNSPSIMKVLLVILAGGLISFFLKFLFGGDDND